MAVIRKRGQGKVRASECEVKRKVTRGKERERIQAGEGVELQAEEVTTSQGQWEVVCPELP